MATVLVCKILAQQGLDPGGISLPEDISLFNFAEVPVASQEVKYWCDVSSPFPNYEIPVGTRWAYTVHVIEQIDDNEHPIKAGQRIGNLYLDWAEAEACSQRVKYKGCFSCVFAALIVEGREKLN